MIAKAGLGLIGLGAIGIGGVAFTKPEWLGINKEIIWKPLSQDNGFDASKDPYNSKFGSTYKNYLVGTSQDNKAWWDEKVKNIKPEEKKGKFTKIKHGFDENDSLKSLCDEAYKKADSELRGDSPEPGENDFKKSDVWKYCSYIGEKPKTVSEVSTEEGDYTAAGSTENSIGKDKKTDLLSIKNGNNSKLWKLKNDEFFGRGVFKSATEPTDEFFKALFKTKSTNKDALKNKCLSAYKSTSATTATADKPKAEDVVKYCSAKSIN